MNAKSYGVTNMAHTVRQASQSDSGLECWIKIWEIQVQIPTLP